MIPLRATSIKDENAGGFSIKKEGFGLIQKWILDISEDPWRQGSDALVHPERSSIKGEDFQPIPIPKHSGRIFYPNSIYLYLQDKNPVERENRQKLV
ncbi:MAG: hypothetical protein ACP5NU_02920 [Methanomicrobiales archaeon]|jgi:hypothetical protein|nr:hypothetical protein [Methanoregulaceae archaeon]HNB02816.1 hypothetical protein [Methanoregulaceae archaeon]HNL86569.1 hypothetical protein [Methanoregulaceae archaeon]HNO07973.1 hypothetical protein [Methanoregulaceae archaeon]HNW80645.1 hypothetical protein [Methanoregulaceae archaeon]